MKGKLHKTESGWVVKYYIMRESSHAIHPNEYTLPILDYGYVNGPELSDSDEGQEIEFKVIEFPVPPTNGPVSNSISKYAQLIDKAFVPMKGGEGWNKILDKAIQDKAETFTDGNYYYRGKDSFIEGYKQGQEDTKGIRYTEEDMRELYAYAKNDNTNLEDYLQALNKQDSEWITIKGDNITVNFKPMPEFDDPKYPEVKIICPRCKAIMPCICNANWNVIYQEFIKDTDGISSLALLEYLRENYNPPTKKQKDE